MNSKIFDAEVSIYPNYNSPESDKVVTLNTWLSSKMYKDKILELRSYEDKSIRNGLKCQLPCVTPSGVFSRREDSKLLKHSGFLAVDIDQDQNPGMNIEEWKSSIIDLGACMCQLSASGLGLWSLFRISNPEKHKAHFQALKEVFDFYDINIDDKCGNLSRLRGISYDENTLYNPDAEIFTGLKEERKKLLSGLIGRRNDEYSNTDNVKWCIDEIIRRKIDITSWYSDWFAIACAFANEFGPSGRSYFHQVSSLYPKYDYDETERQYDRCINSNRSGGYTIKTFMLKCKENGILYTEKKN